MASPIQFASAETKSKVISNCWEYLYDNFHKFTDTNKIKVTLAIITKDMPTKVEGDTKGPQQIVIIRSKEEIVDTTETISRSLSVQ